MAIAIVIILLYFGKSLIDIKTAPIVATDFEKHVKERVENGIKGQEYSIAHSTFSSIMSEILTEESITLDNGKKALTDSEVLKSKQIVFYEYVPIFTKYGLSYFSKSSWDNTELENLQSESNYLIQLNIAEPTTDSYNSIAKIAKIVADYFAAWQVVSRARNCSSVNSIAEIKADANGYNIDPLTNNSSLESALQSVEDEAKRSVVSYIAEKCNFVISSKYDYNNYITFYRAYENACNRISEYTDTYGKNNVLNDAKDRLDKAETEASAYYLNLKK